MRHIRPSMLARQAASRREKKEGVARQKPLIRVGDLVLALDRMHERMLILEADNAALKARLNAYH